MKMFFTALKWEAISHTHHMKWVTVPALALWGLLAVLSLPALGWHGDVASVVFLLLRIAIALAGGYMAFVSPILNFSHYSSAGTRRVLTRLTGIPQYVFVCASMLCKVVTVSMGIELMRLSSAALQTFSVYVFTDVDFFGTLFFVYGFAVFVPSVYALGNAIEGTKIPFAPLFDMLTVIGAGVLFTIAYSYISERLGAFDGSGFDIGEVIVLALLIAVPAALTLAGSWIYENKADLRDDVG